MANFGNPAHSAAMGNLGGMLLVAGGAMSLFQGMNAALDAVNDTVRARRYGDALTAAKDHAAEMEAMARAAVGIISELEAEVAELREACAQRQEVIEALAIRA